MTTAGAEGGVGATTGRRDDGTTGRRGDGATGTTTGSDDGVGWPADHSNPSGPRRAAARAAPERPPRPRQAFPSGRLDSSR